MSLVSKNGKSYASLDFSQITEKGLKPLIDALNRNNVTVIQTTASNKATRKDSIQVKQATITLQDGQELLFQVNDTGDISMVKLNGKVIPVHIGESIADVARSAGTAAARNSKKFTDALAAKAKRAISADLNKKASVKSTAQQIQEVKGQLADKQTSNTALKEQIKGVSSQKDKLSARIEQAKTELAQEKSTGTQLEMQLKELEKTLNV